jgi:hypothetical protein
MDSPLNPGLYLSRLPSNGASVRLQSFQNVTRQTGNLFQIFPAFELSILITVFQDPARNVEAEAA